MALSNNIKAADLTSKYPELSSACTTAELENWIAQAFDGLEGVKHELRLKYHERYRSLRPTHEFDTANIPDKWNELYQPLIFNRALKLAFQAMYSRTDDSSHHEHMKEADEEYHRLLRETPLYYDLDETGVVDTDEIEEPGVYQVR